MAKFCDRLKEALAGSGITAAMLSHKTGISEASISHYLAGHYEPKRKKLDIIAAALGVSPEWLVGNEPINRENSNPFLDSTEKTLLDLFRCTTTHQKELLIALLASFVSSTQ